MGQFVVGVTVAVFCWVVQSGLALDCYFCHTTGTTADVRCNGTVKTCNADQPYCNNYQTKIRNNSYEFTRDCVSAMVCKPNYCEDYVVQGFGRLECRVKCCQKNLCNRDVISVSRAPKACQLSLMANCLLILLCVLYR